MNTVLKAISIIALGAVGATGAMLMCENCPQKEAKLQNKISTEVSKYIEQNPELILEKIAKTEKFSSTIQNFTANSNEAIKQTIVEYLENNQHLIADAINANSDVLVNSIINSEAFKNALPTIQNQAPAESNANVESAKNSNPNQKYQDNWEQLSQNPVAPYVGPKDAKVTVVEFFDFACSHCRAMGPVISHLIKNNPDVKFVFHPLFFISDHSPYAAKVSIAAFRKGKFAEIYQGIITLPELTEEGINQIVVDEGLNLDEIKAMVEEKDIRRGIQDIDALSQVLGVAGVPLMIINGEEMQSRDYNEIQNKLNSLK